MGRPKNLTPRVLGPTFIATKDYWRVTTITPTPDGTACKTRTRWFNDEEAALAYAAPKRADVERANATTVGQAITQYEASRVESGTLPASASEVTRRLRLFFSDPDMPLHKIDADRAADYYEAFRRRTKPNGEPISVDYHRAALINARSMCKWAVRAKVIASNPFLDIEGVGRRRRGKTQLTGDEIRKLYVHCLARAEAGDRAALGVLMALLMALRSSDITRRVVRDVDMGGATLHVTRGKTERSNRPRSTPAVLRPMLRELAAGRPPDAPLFAHVVRDDVRHHTRRWLEQALEKLCAGAYVPRVTPHSLKGSAGTILAETGELADRIADHLSHESSAVTVGHYVAPGALDDARQARALRLITGGAAPATAAPSRGRRGG